MSGRYKVRCGDEGVFVWDAIDGGDVAGPMSWDSAIRQAAACNSKRPPPADPAGSPELNRALEVLASLPPSPPAAPYVCPDCALHLKMAEERAERYRHALAQIYRYSDCRTALRYVEDALYVTQRIKGETTDAV